MEVSEDIRSTIETIVRARFKTEKIRDVTVESWVDDLGDDSLKVHVFVDPDITEEDFGDTTVGLPRKIMNVLTGDVKGRYPYIRFIPMRPEWYANA